MTPALANAPTWEEKREEIMRQREKERLERLLALMFGSRYPLHWTYSETSYFDGKACYVKYDVQTDKHREFTLAEQRIIRQHHAFHERGHQHFDVLEDYIEWQKEWSSNDFDEWKNNLKYPIQWLQFFGNTAMDGRMELLVISTFPTQKDFFDFGNYEWRFGIRGQNSGKDRIYDFQECFMHRCLGMDDITEWYADAVNLVNSVQKDIDRIRTAATTKDCLDITMHVIKKVWPTLWEWLDLNESDAAVVTMPGVPIDNHLDDEMWNSREEAEKNAQKAFEKAGIKPSHSSDASEGQEDGSEASEFSSNNNDTSEGEETRQSDSEAPDNDSDGGDCNEEEKANTGESGASEGEGDSGDTFSREDKMRQLINQIEKQIEKEKDEIDRQEQPYLERKQAVTIKDKESRFTDEVLIKEYPYSDLEKYYAVKDEVRSKINPFARAIKLILEGAPDEIRKNQRKGRLRAKSVWKAQHCNDLNIFERKIKGTPKQNAVVFTQFDNSGSTFGPVINEMRKAAVLIAEGCEIAGVPHYSFAFTEDRGETLIFPLKPTDQLTDREKAYIGGMASFLGNRDTLVLQWTVDQIAKRQEDIKLLIMVSDGIPIFLEGVENEQTMRNIVINAEKKGIDVLCLFVGHNDMDSYALEKVRYMYNNHVINVKNNNLASEMSKHIKRIIMKRRR